MPDDMAPERCPTCWSGDPNIVLAYGGYAQQSSRHACPDEWHNSSPTPPAAKEATAKQADPLVNEREESLNRPVAEADPERLYCSICGEARGTEQFTCRKGGKSVPAPDPVPVEQGGAERVAAWRCTHPECGRVMSASKGVRVETCFWTPGDTDAGEPYYPGTKHPGAPVEALVLSEALEETEDRADAAETRERVTHARAEQAESLLQGAVAEFEKRARERFARFGPASVGGKAFRETAQYLRDQIPGER